MLGPLLFTLHTTPLSSLISGHSIPHHLYADDSQLYVSFSSGDSAAALNGLQACLASVQSWMSMIKLKLHPDKTEFLLIDNERQRSKYHSMFPIELFGVKNYPAKSARNLGVIFDKNFNFRSHIFAICSFCFYHIRDLRRIRHYLDLNGAKLLPFPRRHRHARWPVDVVELLPRFRCWALIWMSRHWAWLRRGYWRYRNLVDWLIDFVGGLPFTFKVQETIEGAVHLYLPPTPMMEILLFTSCLSLPNCWIP